MPNVTLIIIFSALLPIVLVAVIVGGLLRGQQKTDTLLRTGIPARGRILQLGTTGGSVAVMGHRHLKLVFTVEVHPQMGAPYVANFEQLVSELQIASVQPGAMIELRIDPRNPAHMAMAGVGGSPPGMQPGMAQAQGGWGGPQQQQGFGGPQPMGQAGYGAPGMPPQGFAQPVMGVAQPNYKSALPFILFMVFITTVPTAGILLYVFGSFDGLFGSSTSSAKDSESDETEEEKPKKSKAGDTCKKAVKCCKVISQGQAAAVSACENLEKNADGCQIALDAYKQTAAAMKKSCD